MKKEYKIKYIIMILISIGVIGITYAYFTYSHVSENNKSIMGNIYMELKSGSDSITILNAFPESKAEALESDSNYLDFSIEGINSYREPIYYGIFLESGAVPSGYTEDDRMPFDRMKFQLIDLDTDTVLFEGDGNDVMYSILRTDNHMYYNGIYVKTINPTEIKVTHNYRLRMWYREDILISDTDPQADFCASEYCKFVNKCLYTDQFSSFKLQVIGNLNSMSLEESPN